LEQAVDEAHIIRQRLARQRIEQFSQE
jgi:hypothetical protein